MLKLVAALTIALAAGTGSPGSAAPHAGQDKAKDAPTVAGRWALTADTPHGTMSMSLTLSQERSSVTGTWVDPHGQNRPVSGEFTDRQLKLATADSGDRITLTARLADTDTLNGFLSSTIGDFKWTATRAREPKK